MTADIGIGVTDELFDDEIDENGVRSDRTALISQKRSTRRSNFGEGFGFSVCSMCFPWFSDPIPDYNEETPGLRPEVLFVFKEGVVRFLHV